MGSEMCIRDRSEIETVDIPPVPETMAVAATPVLVVRSRTKTLCLTSTISST